MEVIYYGDKKVIKIQISSSNLLVKTVTHIVYVLKAEYECAVSVGYNELVWLC